MENAIEHRNGVYDLLLGKHRAMLEQSGLMKSVTVHMDHYTQFERVHPDDLAPIHRWTEDDIGKAFTGFEFPDDQGRGIVFEVVVSAVFNQTFISFEVTNAFELTCDAEGDETAWYFGPFPEQTKFEIDAEHPITEETMDRVCAMLDYEETYERFRLLLAIQDWALQPTKIYLQ